MLPLSYTPHKPVPFFFLSFHSVHNVWIFCFLHLSIIQTSSVFLHLQLRILKMQNFQENVQQELKGLAVMTNFGNVITI